MAASIAHEIDQPLSRVVINANASLPFLTAYKAIIDARLAAYPALSAVRLLAEIRAAGYDGSYTPDPAAMPPLLQSTCGAYGCRR
jgi:hypothetical protein